MFEETKLLGTPPPKPIPLATRLGNPIDNEPGVGMTEEARQMKEVIAKVRGKNWEPRLGPAAGYNCAGHVWASRRAAIYEHSEWKKILADDGYALITEKYPLPGDLALYLLPDDKIVHIAEVVRIEGHLLKKPWALSKWDDLSGEYVHNVDDVPFKGAFDYRLEYWTERGRKPNDAAKNKNP